MDLGRAVELRVQRAAYCMMYRLSGAALVSRVLQGSDLGFTTAAGEQSISVKQALQWVG